MPTIERRVSPDGTVRFRARVRLHGARTASKTFRRKTDAQKWAQKTEVAIREDQYAVNPMSRRKTLGELIDRYVSEVLPRKPRTAPFQKRQLEIWRKGLGHLMIADMTPARIVAFRQTLLDTPGTRKQARGYATTNRYLAVLSHAFTFAVDEWGWATREPGKEGQASEGIAGANSVSVGRRASTPARRRVAFQRCARSLHDRGDRDLDRDASRRDTDVAQGADRCMPFIGLTS